MQQAWERRLVVSNCFPEVFHEMVGLCKPFRWESCCCMLCVLITWDQSPSGGQRRLHGEKYLFLLGFLEEEKEDFFSLTCCALPGLSCTRALLVKTLLEGKGRQSRSISRGGFITKFLNQNLHRAFTLLWKAEFCFYWVYATWKVSTKTCFTTWSCIMYFSCSSCL